MAQSIRVITHIQVQAGKETEAVSLLKELVAVTRTETGCLRYELLQSSVVAQEFALVEEWQSEDAFNRHMQSPQVQEALLEGEAFLVHPPDIRRYQLII